MKKEKFKKSNMATWRDTEPNSDPQTDFVYLHVLRVRAAPMTICDTVYHIEIQTESTSISDRYRESQLIISQAKKVVKKINADRTIKRWVESQFVPGFTSVSFPIWKLIVESVYAMSKLTTNRIAQ
jgi:hypothetical protein